MIVVSLRDELISKIREPLHELFPDLLLTELGLVTESVTLNTYTHVKLEDALSEIEKVKKEQKSN